MLSVPDGAKVRRSEDHLMPPESTLLPTQGPIPWTGRLLADPHSHCLLDLTRRSGTAEHQGHSGVGRPPGPGAECTCFFRDVINVGPSSTSQPGLGQHQSLKAPLWTKGCFLL